MTMVIPIELRIFNQIGFGPKNGNPTRNAGTLKTIVCQTGKVAAWGFLFIHEI